MDGRIGGQLKGLEGRIVQGHLVVDTCLMVIRRLVLLVMIGQLQLPAVVSRSLYTFFAVAVLC